MKNYWLEKEMVAAINNFRLQGVPEPLSHCIHASRLLGSCKSLVIHGGGNSSVKTISKDIMGRQINTIFVKSSGYDMDCINVDGFTALDLDRLKELEGLNTLDDDHMVAALAQAKLDPGSPAPSVESLMHIFLPAPFILHTHANAVLAVTNQPAGKNLANRVFGNDTIILPYTMSGFALAKKAATAVRKSPSAKAIIVLKHGIFTFGESAKEAYDCMIRIVRLAEECVKKGRKRIFSSVAHSGISSVADFAPILRGALMELADQNRGTILDFRTSHAIRRFVDDKEVARFATAGPVTPDHVIWTKPKPLILPPRVDGTTICRELKKFARAYKRYFETNNMRVGGDKIMREALPRVILVQGLGLFGVGETARTASIVADIAETSVDVITAAESIERFSPASAKDIFDLEYWAPEGVKLQTGPATPLQGKVAVITGGGSGIGAATAQIFSDAGAEVAVLDINSKAVEVVASNLDGLGLAVDVTDGLAVRKAFNQVVSVYGGLDIVISNAGAAWQGEIGMVSDSVLRESFELNFFAHQTVAQSAVRVMQLQNTTGGMGGCILFNISKQAVNPGKNFGPYGLPKAATLFLVRQYALDHGKDGIRTGGVNADRIRTGLLTEQMIAGRSKARRLSKKQYMTGNLLGREVTAHDVAKGFLDLALSQSITGAVLTVDGGNIEAALR